MATVAVTKENLDETLSDNEIVFLDFWADWCRPCHQFAPVFEQASDKHTDITFGKIDTEDQQQIAAAANIRSIPTLMAFRDGILVFSQAGALPAPSLEQLIGAVRDLDMEDVRRQIAEAAASAPAAPGEAQTAH